MRQSIRKIVGKFRRKHRENLKAPSEKDRARRRVTRRKKRADVTGQTVFHDRPLQFRNLTVTQVDIPTLTQSAIEGAAFKIRIAKRGGAHRDASTLVREKYATRGYAVPARPEKPRVFTFIAYDEGHVVGTVSVGMDSEAGLFADGPYRAEIDRMRAAGYRVCEFTRLAVNRNVASKRVLAGLFHTAYLFACKIRGCTHAVIEVNPRHVLFYGKELRFDVIGTERMDERVHAPAVLLCVSFNDIARGLAESAGKRAAPGAKRTLFHYGFPEKEEKGVLERLNELVAGNSGPQRAQNGRTPP